MLHDCGLLTQAEGPSCLDGATNNVSVGLSYQHGATDGARRGGPFVTEQQLNSYVLESKKLHIQFLEKN
jgi:hypothetical protein